MHSKMMTVFVECVRLDLENYSKCPTIQKQHQAKENRENMNQPQIQAVHLKHDLNLTTANFDSYGNVSFDPCEFTLHTAANAENNDW